MGRWQWAVTKALLTKALLTKAPLTKAPLTKALLTTSLHWGHVYDVLGDQLLLTQRSRQALSLCTRDGK